MMAKDEEGNIKELVAELQERVLKTRTIEELQQVAIAGCVDTTLRHFLLARDLNLDKSYDMLISSLQWRKESNIQSILQREVLSKEKKKAIRQNHPQGFHLTDKFGHPVWIERTGFIDIDAMIKQVSIDDVLDHHIQTIEYQQQVLFTRSSKEQGRIIDKMTVIHDLSKCGRHNLRPIVFQVLQRIASIDQDNYPENLNRLFIVNAPFIFYGAWKVIEVFLNEKTRKKIRILGKNFIDEVTEVIEKEKLPAFLGGGCKCRPDQEHGGCVSSKTSSSTPFFDELDRYVNQHATKSTDGHIQMKGTMTAVWLSNLEKDLVLIKMGKSSVVRRPSTSGAIRQPSTQSEHRSPLNQQRVDDQAENKSTRKAIAEATWTEWRSKKDKELRNAKLKAKEIQIEEEERKSSAQVDPQIIAARFKEWKISKWRHQQELKRQDKQRDIEYEKLQLQLREHRQEKLKLRQKDQEKQLRLLKKPLRIPKIVSSKHIAQQGSLPISTPAHTAKLESLAWVNRGLIFKTENPVSSKAETQKRVERAIPSRERREARLQHQSYAYRADTLMQLRSWKQPSHEIYLLGSIIHKILYYEMKSESVLLDAWRWLPWKIVRQAFHDDLVARLDRLDIGDMKSATLALLYVHISAPHFKPSSIKKRSKVASALRIWITNVAGVHDIVDTHTHRPLPIDHLVRAGVRISDVARAYLMIEVYPYVDGRLPNCCEPSDSRTQNPKRQRHGEELKKLSTYYDNDSIVLYNISIPPEETSELSMDRNFDEVGTKRESARVILISD